MNTSSLPLRAATAVAVCLLMLAGPALVEAQNSSVPPNGASQELENQVQRLTALVQQLQERVTRLENQQKRDTHPSATPSVSQSPSAEPAIAAESAQAPVAVESRSMSPQTGDQQLTTADKNALAFLHDTTINLLLDGYYEYNFNRPVGRVNALRAYDVLSNNFSLNQAAAIFERAPDVSAGRRWGGRLDLQFGQATDTLQGNPLNEPRPQIYRNIFQAYGTYIFPIGHGLNVDFGKFASSLGFENNYTKDQINYSRSYYFNFLPFYHFGVRTNYKLNDQFQLNYWIVNGTNQAEATNGYKDELFGFAATPTKAVSWTSNYYVGQEHPDRIVVAQPVLPIPVQPGLTFEPIVPAPNGKLHIFDNYLSWQTTPKLTLALEGDYVIQRLWRNSAPGRSSAPSYVYGGAAYAKYQFTPKLAIATRGEYLNDHGGLFSGMTQALKESTVTFDYQIADGFLTRYEWRRDFSNEPSFFTSLANLLSKHQTTATVGLIMWWGRKQGTW